MPFDPNKAFEVLEPEKASGFDPNRPFDVLDTDKELREILITESRQKVEQSTVEAEKARKELEPGVVSRSLTQAGTGITQGLTSLGKSLYGGASALATVVPVPMPGKVRGRIVEFLDSRARNAGEVIKELETLGQEQPGSRAFRMIGQGATSVIPSFVAGPFGITAAATAAALQSFGSMYVDQKEQFKKAGVDDDTAALGALAPALASGTIEGIVTRAIPGGVESWASIAKSGTLKGVLKSVIKGASLEAPEEFFNGVGQGFLRRVTTEPGKEVEEILKESIEEAGVGALLGGAVTGVAAAAEPAAFTPPPLKATPNLNKPNPIPPVPEPVETIQKQVELTADPNSTKAATHITPGSPTPTIPEGLVAVPVPGDQGTVIVNPAKADPQTVADKASTGEQGIELGFSQATKPEGNTVVQTKKDGVVVLDEVVSPDGIEAATKAHQAAVPGGETTVTTAEAVIEERQATPEPTKSVEPTIPPGPGASTPEDIGAGIKKRKFTERFKESKEIQLETRESTGNEYYSQVSNEETNAAVNVMIERGGIENFINRLLKNDPTDTDLTRERRVAGALNVIKRLNKQATDLDAQGRGEEANHVQDRIIQLAETIGEFGTELGRAVQAFRMWSALTPEGMLRRYVNAVKQANQIEQDKATKRGKKPKQIKIDPKLSKDIIDGMEAAQKLPEGFQRDQAVIKVMGKIATAEGISPVEMGMAWWYASILSSPITQIVNTLGGFTNVLAEAGIQIGLNPRRAPDILAALFKGLRTGFSEAKAILKEGDYSRKAGTALQAPTTLELLKDSDSKFKRLLSSGRFVSRLMAAADTLNFTGAQEMRALALAYEIGKKENLTGNALSERVSEILNNTDQLQKEAEAQANQEGLTGYNAKRRVQELIEKGRPADLMDSAIEFALKATYNNKPYGLLGSVAEGISNVSRNHPYVRFIVPFVNIVSNVTNVSLNYTPYGYKRAFFDSYKLEAPTGSDFDAQVARATSGTIGMAAVLALWASMRDEKDKWFDITSSGPRDRNERHQLMATGWRPYTIKVGDKYLSYANTPLLIPFAIIGSFADSHTYNAMEDEGLGLKLAYGMSQAASSVFNQSFLQSLANFLEVLQGTNVSNAPDRFAKMGLRTGTSFVIPNAVKWIDRIFDPEYKQTDSLKQMLIADIPVARSTQLKPLINVLGQPVRKEGIARAGSERFFSDVKEDPVWKMIVDKQAWISVPSKNAKIGKRTMDQEEYYEYMKSSGQAIHKRLQAEASRINALEGEDAQKAVRDIVNNEREKARSILRNEAIRKGTLQ